MDYASVYIDLLYALMTGLVPLIVPVIAIYLIFRIIAKFIIGDK